MKNENKCVLYYSNRVDFKKLTQHDFNNWSQKQTFIQFISIWQFRTKIIRNVLLNSDWFLRNDSDWLSTQDFQKGALKAVFRNDSDGYQKTIQFIQVAISK